MNSSTYKLVIVSGPTREWIDPVRFLSNPSSGQTGWSIAKAGLNLGFKEIVFISGPGLQAYRTVDGCRTISVETTEEMAAAVQAEASDDQLLIMAAAPADYTPAYPKTTKIKKTDQSDFIQLELKPTVDILKSVSALPFEHYYRVGFAAETDTIKEYARDKLRRKNLKYICANEVFRDSKGFGSGENRLLVLGSDGSEQSIGPLPKLQLAKELLSYITQRLP